MGCKPAGFTEETEDFFLFDTAFLLSVAFSMN